MTEEANRLEQLRQSHRRSITRQATVQFVPFHTSETVLFVVVDGVVYRREKDQEGALLSIQESDLERDFIDRFGPEAFDAAFQLTGLIEAQMNHDRNRSEEALVKLLPRHEKTIRYAFDPDAYEYTLMTDDLREQAPCLQLVDTGLEP